MHFQTSHILKMKYCQKNISAIFCSYEIYLWSNVKIKYKNYYECKCHMILQ